MNAFVATPVAGIVPMLPSRAAQALQSSPRAALEAYASWLFMERRLLCMELYPHLGADAERFDWADNAGFNWHFRSGMHWSERPQPSTRASSVLDLVGVNWRSRKENLGLDHTDNGQRPDLPLQWPYVDGELVAAATNITICELAIKSIEDLKCDSEYEDQFNAVYESRGDSLNILCSTPAVSVRGLEAKAMALEAVTDSQEYAFEDLARSIASDIIRVTKLKAPSPSVTA